METDKKDMAQDKAMVKKAFSMHDAQEHKGERTNLSKLKKGGKMKMKKFAIGGTTTAKPATTSAVKDATAFASTATPKATATTAPAAKATTPASKVAPRRGGRGEFGPGPGYNKAKGGTMKKYAAGGITKEMPTSKDMGNMGMAEGGKVKKLAMGGLGTMPMARPGVAPMYGAPAMAPAMAQAPMGMTPTYKKGGKIMTKKACSGGKMASGGSFRTSANGVASKGKTKGTQVKMYAKGGSVSPDGVAQRGKTRAPSFR